MNLRYGRLRYGKAKGNEAPSVRVSRLVSVAASP